MAVLDYQIGLDQQSATAALPDRRRHFSAREAFHPVFALQRQAGNQAVQQLLRRTGIQPKLAISQPDDSYEREADKVADRIMRMPEPSISSVAISPAYVRQQRAVSPLERDADQVADRVMRSHGGAPISSPCSCSEGEEMCEECKQKQQVAIARKAESTPDVKEVSSTVHEVVRSPGQPLDSATRSFFEPRFGRDLSDVRVHTSAEAAQSARSIEALAYSAGNHIVFGSQQYQPSTSHGKHLLAHELAHVIQEENARVSSVSSGSLHRKVAVDPSKFAGANAANDRASFKTMIANELIAVTGMNLAFSGDVLRDSGTQAVGGSATARQVLNMALNDQNTVWFDPSPQLGAQDNPGRGIEIGIAQPAVRLKALRLGIVIIHELAHHYAAQLKPSGYDARMQQLLKDAQSGKQLTPAEAEQLRWYTNPSGDENIAVATENKVQQELGLIQRIHYAIEIEFPDKPGKTGAAAWTQYSVFKTTAQPPQFLYLNNENYDLYSSAVDYFQETVRAGHPVKPAPGAMVKVVRGTPAYQAVQQHLL